ncbi:hypothetical protein AXF19_02575 [Selenomonas sp. oral taxon 126]|uniref:HIRAN domain-containing protein n=1 Tax=Selenomonas sp. oral taxon 126 TaxID=712528 RepID=UPI0008078463|nr:HIRAN domain-containing protein [Selenomonas sp. oral taxon 126]ANR69986.1 hypothetical protein AXF19_02575 [Selenomonas sp. oral taxon 126]
MQLTKGMPGALVGAWGGDALPPAPFSQAIYLTHFPIAGAYYVEGWADLVADMQAGDTLNLLREPENEHDTHAIKVVDAAQKKLGYMPRRMNHIPARLMDAWNTGG